MNIYNPLQYTGKSFTSSVKETFQQQEAKKQASIERMNETLRTQAAQGRLGSLANSILNDALTQASEQGLIGVNQYEVMNQAMPKFYAAKSAVTDLNNSYNAELKAAEADESINVDANFLAYLNDKYYSDDVTLETIDSHAANVVNKGFNIAEHTEFLNDEYVLDKVIPTMVTQFSKSEYGVVGQEEGMDVFGTTTTTGVVRANADNITNFTANPQVEALLIKKAREANPNVDITNLNLQVPKAEQARLMNEVLDAKFPTSSTIAGAGISEAKTIELRGEETRRAQAAAFYREREDRQQVNKHAMEIALHMKGTSLTAEEAAEDLKNKIDEKTGKPLYNAKYLADAVKDINDKTIKSYASDREYAAALQGANKLYADPSFNTAEGLLNVGGRSYGDIMLSGEKVEITDPDTRIKTPAIEFTITRGTQELYSQPIVIKLDENGNPDPSRVQALKDILVTHQYGAQFIGTGTGSLENKGLKYFPPEGTSQTE